MEATLDKVNKNVSLLDGARKHVRLLIAADEIVMYQQQIQSYRVTLQLSLQTIVLMHIPNRDQRCTLLISLYEICKAQREFEECRTILLQMLSIQPFDRFGGKINTLDALIYLADTLRELGSYPEAMLYARRGLKGFRKFEGVEGETGVQESLEILIQDHQARRIHDDPSETVEEVAMTPFNSISTGVESVFREFAAVQVAASHPDPSTVPKDNQTPDITPEILVSDSLKDVIKIWEPQSKSLTYIYTIVLLGLKSDLRVDTGTIRKLAKSGQHPVTRREAQDVQEKIGAKHSLEYSAMTGQGVNSMEPYKFS
ncbi:hypothetical protein VTL71DRAFT_6874 [Oculimacula yallundae]|uniref:Uncharacterized protein n=1 Tax=Oculimacula yallundae TaxID=86028 RepID=A0ABR4BV58_9HELO